MSVERTIRKGLLEDNVAGIFLVGKNASDTLTVLLYKNGYPPEWDEEVFEKVMEQAENFKKYADVSSDAPGPAKAKIYQYAPSTSAVLKVAEEPAPYGTKKN